MIDTTDTIDTKKDDISIAYSFETDILAAIHHFDGFTKLYANITDEKERTGLLDDNDLWFIDLLHEIRMRYY